MRTLSSFIMTTLDGFYAGPNEEFDWPNVDDEFIRFSISQINDADAILFGRRTYEALASYWPTPQSQRNDPALTRLMNGMPKIVFSSTLERADWENTTLVTGDLAAEVTKLKDQPGKELIVFGSQELTGNLIRLGRLDELRVMVNPVTLSQGRSMFQSMAGRVRLRLLQTRVFSGSGNVLLTYEPLTGEGGAT
jgi:dihydrofolate reductase